MPVVAVLLVFGFALIVLTSGSAIAPFIYIVLMHPVAACGPDDAEVICGGRFSASGIITTASRCWSTGRRRRSPEERFTASVRSAFPARGVRYVLEEAYLEYHPMRGVMTSRC